MKCIHRTTHEAAKEIVKNGFSLDRFGSGAGAGSGEPAGVFVSPGDGHDFNVESEKRNLPLSALLEVEFTPKNLVRMEHDDRIARFKECRLLFLCEKFSISREDAQAIASFKVRILNARPDLSAHEEWASSKSGEAELAKFFSRALVREGIDAIAYRDPWQGVEQIIILDSGIINRVTPVDRAENNKKPAP
jgi:hypothetical protein